MVPIFPSIYMNYYFPPKKSNYVFKKDEEIKIEAYNNLCRLEQLTNPSYNEANQDKYNNKQNSNNGSLESMSNFEDDDLDESDDSGEIHHDQNIEYNLNVTSNPIGPNHIPQEEFSTSLLLPELNGSLINGDHTENFSNQTPLHSTNTPTSLNLANQFDSFNITSPHALMVETIRNRRNNRAHNSWTRS